MNSSSSRKFTVQHLLLVLTFVGLIAGIALSSLTAARVKARDLRRITDVNNLGTAIEIYKTSTGKLPSQISDLVAKNIIETPTPKQDPTANDSYRYQKYPTDSGADKCAGEFAILCVKLEKPKNLYFATSTAESCYDDPKNCPVDDPNWLVYMFSM
jgi:type II secretory pathway pseudopilin PulG